MTMTLTNAQAKMEAAKEALRKAEDQVAQAKEAQRTSTPAMNLAVAIHDSTCTHNHTDYCNWLYEEDRGNIERWNQWTHERYLAKASNILENVDVDADIAIQIVQYL